VVRDLLVLGYNHKAGHCEVLLEDVRIPVTNLLGAEGGGFEIAQARLGPGRIHHCMRSIGAAERALELMCKRAQSRIAFGKPLAEQGLVQKSIADSRIEIDQARLLTYHAAWLMDRSGNKVARTAISEIKVAVPAMASRVLDRSMQVHGAAGLSQDFPMAEAFARQRALRILDGPDEVHLRTIARNELGRYADA
jgi:acyl-CoA dehydrogenase